MSNLTPISPILQPDQSVPSSQQGVVLIEAMIAILIFSFAVLGIVGLQAAMIKNTSESKYRTDASYIAQQAIGNVWADPANIANYLEVDTDISGMLPNGKRTITQPSTGVLTVTISWQQPGEDAHQFVTTATIAGG